MATLPAPDTACKPNVSEQLNLLPAPIAPPLPDGDFDWFTDPAILVEEQMPIAIYQNDRGHVVIRQKDDWDRDDICVCIAPDNLMAVIDKLCDIAGIGNAGGAKS